MPVLLGAVVFVSAQTAPKEYEIDTLVVFPNMISSDSWQNIETLNTQDLPESSLYQHFTKENAAYLPSYRDIQEVDKKSDAAGAQASNVSSPDGETSEGVSADSVGSTTIRGTNKSESDETAASDGVEPATTNSGASSETSSGEELETEAEASQKEPMSSTTVFRRVQGVFSYVYQSVVRAMPFAQVSTSTPTTEEGGEDEDVPGNKVEEETSEETVPVEEIVSEEADDVHEASVSSGAPSSTPSGSATGTSMQLAPERADTSSTTPETDTEVTEVLTSDGTSEIDTQDSSVQKAHSIRFDGFALPLEGETEVVGGQLRMSFAAKERQRFMDETHTLSISYSFDGGKSWQSGGTIEIDDETSNSINGGYFLFAFPEISDIKQLASLAIEIHYIGDSTQLDGIYLDSVWLELFTANPKEEELGAVPFTLPESGYDGEMMRGDELTLPDDKEIEFTFTDDNTDETLIIKSDRREYIGLSEAVTYFNVTNTSDESDMFTIGTHFESDRGEMVSLEEWDQNKPYDLVVPEYRPYIYHCKAGWEVYEEQIVNNFSDFGQLGTTTTGGTAEEPQSTETILPPATSTAPEGTVEDVSITPTTTISETAVPEVETASSSSEGIFEALPGTSADELLLASATSAPATTTQSDTESGTSTASAAAEETGQQYVCGVTNVVRTCDAIEGEGTSCRINSKKVAEHVVEQFRPGWQKRQVASGTPPDNRSLLKKVVNFFGIGEVEQKGIPAPFREVYHSPNTFTIAPGETKYFKMKISFPSFSEGEFWIEATGENSLYGLLDPFWSSEWLYRIPITLDNTQGTSELTEHQVFLELASATSSFWTNVNGDGSDIRFVRETPGSDDGTWYDQNWQRRIALTIQSTQVEANLSDFPVYVDLSTLGNEFFTLVQSDGGDIRVTESDGVTEVPREVVSISTTGGTGELYFRAGSVSSTTNTTFYMYYNNGGASDYASTSPFGAQNVWTNNYEAVFHFEEDPGGSAPQYIDSTGNGHDASVDQMGSGNQVNGQFGNGVDANGTDESVIAPGFTNLGTSNQPYAMGIWFNADIGETDGNIIGMSVNSPPSGWRLPPLALNSDLIQAISWTGSQSTALGSTPITQDSWSQGYTTWSSADGLDVYLDGDFEDNNTQATYSASGGSNYLHIAGDVAGGAGDEGHFNGQIDELRVLNTSTSSEWIGTEFNNQNAPTTFYATSSVESFIPATHTELDYWLQYFSTTTSEADVWVQVDSIPAGATTTIYLYYGNSGATSASDEYEPFTYSTTTDTYYVVDDGATGAIEVYSLIDNNIVQLDNNAPNALDAGETVSLTGYSGASVIRTLGPISATVDDAGADSISPVAFASTTQTTPTNRNTTSIYVMSPFASSTVRTYIGGSGAPDESFSVATGTVVTSNTDPGGGNGVIIEATDPVLAYHFETANRDSFVSYPPTTDDIFGIDSNNTLVTTLIDNPDPSVYCSGGNTGSSTGITRGEAQAMDICADADEGVGDAIRYADAQTAIMSIQQADSDGSESTIFLPQYEFGTEYYLSTDSAYVAVACSPRFGTSTIEVQTNGGSTVDSATCAPNGQLPGKAYLDNGQGGDALAFTAGHKVISTNGVPFYAIYEDDEEDNDETNLWSSVQGRKHTRYPLKPTFGAQETNNDAQYEQHSFLWYENGDVITPTSTWPLDDEGSKVSEGVSITGGGAVNTNDVLRLRMNLLANVSTGTVGSLTSFKLQYAQAATDQCSSVASSDWHNLGGIGSSTVAFSGYNNTGVDDGAELASTTLASSTVFATYEEENQSSPIPNEIGVGKVAEWDWVIESTNASTSANYCFRMVRANGTELTTYTNYPQLETSGPPNTPTLSVYFDNERTADLDSVLEFVATDLAGDDLHYQVQIDDDYSFGSPAVDRNSETHFSEFENVSDGSDKSPFNSGALIRFTSPTTLVASTTYWWRARARDPDGSGIYGDWSDPFSFTTDGSVLVSEWFQTTDEQFETDSLTSASTTGSGSIVLDVGTSTIGEYGTVVTTNGSTSTVNLNNTYANPVIVASVRYSRSGPDGTQRVSRVTNKTSTSFDILTDNDTSTVGGTTTVDYIVMEAGEWIMEDGSSGLRIYASSTSVSASAGQPLPSDPGGTVVTFPTSFSGSPTVLATITSYNDSEWVFASTYDGSNKDNPPTATTLGLFLNDNFDSNGHGSAEDIDFIAFEQGAGTNNGSEFDITTSGSANVTDTPTAISFSPAFSSTPQVTTIQSLTNNGGDGGYAMVDTDNPATINDVTVSIDEDGAGADRGHGGAEEVGVVAFASATGTILRDAGTGVVTTNGIDFDDGTVGNAWGELLFNDSGTITYHVEYNVGSGFTDIPDSALSGNSSGFTTSPVSLLSLDTDTYNEIRLVAILSGADPELFDWNVTWGQRVNTPTLLDPFDHEKIPTTTPTLEFTTTDPQGDDLEYEVSWSTDNTFASGSTTVNSSTSPGFGNLSTPADTNPFNSGDTITYTLSGAETLIEGETYWWRVRAKDPDDGDAFSPWSDADAFTADSSVTVSTWFQTTAEQFQTGTLTGVSASTTADMVTNDSTIGEYGSAVITNGSSTVINLQRTYNDPVVVTSVRYSRSSETQRVTRVLSKTPTSFMVLVDNYNSTVSGTTTVDYAVVEAGDWTIQDGASGMRIVADTIESVSTVRANNVGDVLSGTQVNFSPAFSAAPSVITNISSNNDSSWVFSSIHSQSDVTLGPTAAGFTAWLNRNYESGVHDPEDIDYIAFESGHGVNDSSEMDFVNSSDTVTDTPTAVSFTSAFSSTPQVTLVQQATQDGGNGGYALVDTDNPVSTSDITVALDEDGSGADRTHTDEIVAIAAFENASGLLYREDTDGTIASPAILFSDGGGPKFEQYLFYATSTGGSTTTLQVQYLSGTSTWSLIPDAAVPGNSTGTTTSPVDLTNVDVGTYDIIRLLGTLECSGINCPTLNDWTVEWSEGVSMSGTLKEYDRSTNVASGTIRVAVNGSLIGSTGSVSGGTWTVNNVTAFAGDVVTVFVNGANDDEEAVTVFVYDGVGDMTGVQLFERHLSIAANETGTTTLALLSSYDNSISGDEDVFFDVTALGNLEVCDAALSGCGQNNLYVGQGQLFIPATSTSEEIATHDYVNYGTVELDGNTLKVSGSWDNNSTTSVDTSTVVFTATSTTETVDDSFSGTLSFNNLTFGEGSGSATWQTADPVDVNGNLSVTYGTLDRTSSTITVSGNLVTGANGFWSGIATTTFDGSGSSQWSDSNATAQDIGYTIIDGDAKTVVVQTDVRASSITIGANDILDAGGANTIEVGGNFKNNNTFTPRTSTVNIVATGTSVTITPGASSFNNLTFSGVGTASSFTNANVTVLGDLTIATGTVTMPTTRMSVDGSFQSSGGTFAHNNGEVRFTGSGAESVTASTTTFLNAFYDLSFTGSGSWVINDVNATTSHDLTISNGNVTFPSGTFTVGGDFTVSGSGGFDHNSGEVTFLITDSDTIEANGLSFNNTRFRAGGSSGVWYDLAWGYRLPIIIESDEVTDDMTDFPVYVDLSDLGSQFFSNLNSDGGDIRVTESDGTTEVAREVVSASTTLETGELYFLTGSLSSSTDATFYIYYGNPVASDHASTSMYGAQNVWTNGFESVLHLEEDPGGAAPQMVDSAGNSHDGTTFSMDSSNQVGGKFGLSVDHDGAGADRVRGPGFSSLGTLNQPYSISAWFNPDAGETDGNIIHVSQNAGGDGWCLPMLAMNSDNIQGISWAPGQSTALGSTGIIQGAWSQGYTTWDATNGLEVYLNGGLEDSTPQGAFSASGASNYIHTGFDPAGCSGNEGGFNGQIDEVRIYNERKPLEWIETEYNNQSTTTDFYTVGSLGLGPSRIFSDTNATVLGDVIIESGTVTLPSGVLSVGGSFDNDDTFAHSDGTVRFNSTGGAETVAPGTSSFATIDFDSTTGDWTITENATATTAFTLTNAGDFTLGSGLIFDVAGMFTNTADGASTTWAGSVLRLSSGTDYEINASTTSGDAYGTMLLTGDTDVSMWNSTSSIYTTQASSSIYSQDHNGVDGDLYIFGDYVRTSGTEYWSYATDFDGTSLDATTSRQVNVRVANGSFVTASGSVLRILGNASASTTVDSESGTFALTSRTATVTARYFEMTGTNIDGLNLTSSSTVTLLDDALFTIGAGVSAVTVDASTIDTNPAKQFFDTDFVTGGGNVNVTLVGTPTSYWWFRDGSGDRYGEAFDNNDGNPGSIRWDDSAFTVNISGTVFSDDGETALGGPTCDGSTENVRIVVDGGFYASSTSCNGIDGSYAFTNVSYNGDPTVTVYLDTNGGEKGAMVTRTPTTDITDLNIYRNRVMTRHEDTAPMTIARMTAYDENDDSDIPYVAATGSPDTLTVRPDTELIVASSTTFVPDGNITLQSGGSGNVWDGSFHVDDNATFTATGTESHMVGGSFFLDTGGTLSSASSTFTFTSTTTGRTLTGSSSITFYDLDFTGLGGGWNVNTDLTINENIEVATGTLTGTGSITIPSGSFTGEGLVSLGGGTVTLEESSALGGSQSWTFNNLTLGSGSVVGTTTRAGTATTSVNGVLTVSTAHFLDAASSSWNLGGSGSVFVEDGTFLPGTSMVRYSGSTGSNVLSTTYYNLDLNGSAGTPTYTATGLGIITLGNLTVGGESTTTATFDTNDPALQVDGDVFIRTNGTLVGSDSGSFTVSSNWDNDGTFTGSGGTVTFDGGGAVSIAAGASSFSNVTVNGAGDFTITENATATGAFTLTSHNTFTLPAGNVLAVGGTFTNGLGGGNTTWTDSILFLYGGGNYEANASTTSDTYATLKVGSDTDVRLWNSSAATTTVDSTGSLYSQDHSGVDGDLYIYGNYPGDGGTDYWNYNRDFDGTDLSGSGRKVDVYIENGGGVVYTNGGLHVLGTSTASTTIQNQGSGTYGFRVGGSASTSMQYYEVRNTDINGLVFSGTPNVATLSRGDYLVTTASGTGITVGGDTIDANPARTFSQNIFATTTAIIARNVTATGTSVSSWRFTNHTGNIAGEAFDVDPDGDPGYIVWDDSAANITISGNVYSDEGSSVSTVCDSSTFNIELVVAGLTSYSATCNGDGGGGGTGLYSIPGVSFSPGDSIIVYINGEAEAAATVSKDPASNINNMHLYENRVIVRHEGSDPLSIADMAVWDSSDDGDIPFTAIDAGSDTLTLPSDTKLIVWNNKEFEPDGNVTLSGGGGGAAYDGTLELYTNADWTSNPSESHSVGGSMILGAGASFEASTAAFTMTTSDAGRTVDVNEDTFYDLTFNGSGSWTVTDANLTVSNDLAISSGAVTLPTGTTTIGGSFDNTGGSFNASGGLFYFTSTSGGETVETGGSDMATVRFNGSGGSWTLQDTDATTTGTTTIENGSVTLPSGVFAIGGDFIVLDTAVHNSGAVRMTDTAGNTLLTLSGNDLYSVVLSGGTTLTLTDGSAALLGDLIIEAGTFISATGTLSIGGSFDAASGIYTHSTGTVLFNSSDTGETVDPGTNHFYNAQFSSAGGGWTLQSATTTNNFSLTAANSFTLTNGETLTIENIFTNLVGGGATTWTGTTLRLLSGTNYTINTKSQGGDQYEVLSVAPDTDIRMWDSSAAAPLVATSSSLYSQDHAGGNGDLYIYGDYHRATGTDYWNYENDFDGTAIGGGAERPVFVSIQGGATTTIEGTGSLQILGSAGATTTIQNQGSGTYTMNVTGGTFNAQYYAFRDVSDVGLTFTGTPTVTSLSFGDFELAENNAILMRVSTTTINANASKIIANTRFAATSSFSGTNVSLTGGTTTNAWTFVNHTGDLSGENFDIDGGTDCGSLRWDDSSCLLTQQTHYRWRNDDGGEGVPNSEWYNASWDKRKRVRLDNDDTTTYTNAAIKLDVTYDADMQPDFDDLRFTDSSGTTSIPYWVERYTASTDATVWVQVPTLTGNDTTIVYMYYDNLTATTTGSSTEVFTVADDFEDGNISEYAGDTSLFTVGGSFSFGGFYGLDASGDPNAKATDGISRSDLVVSQGEIIRYMQYVDTSGGSADEVCTLFGVQEPVTANNNYGVCIELFGTDRMSLVRDAVNTETSAAAVLGSTTVSYSTGWYEIEVDWQTDDDIEVTLFNASGGVVATTSANNNAYASGTVGFTFWGQHGGWDSYTSRPRVDNEPTAYFGAEQTDGGATWAENIDTVSNTFEINDTARLRVAIENSGLDITGQLFELQYAAKGGALNCESVSYASYAEVPNQASCAASPVCMQTSVSVADGEATSDHLTGVNGDFTPGEVVESPSNESSSLDVDQNEYTELEYVITPTVNASDAYCFRVTNDGSDLDAYTSVPELQVSFSPSITVLSLNDGLDIELLQGTTTTIYATGTITDLNGYADLSVATNTVFRNGPTGVGEDCTPDDNNCYRSVTPGLCSFTGCAGNSCNVLCTADIYYFADPTDVGTYAGDSWTAYLEVVDQGDKVATATSPSVDLLTTRALSVSNAIDYGTLGVNTDTGSYNATTTIENIGNDSIDVGVEGTDLTDGGASTIPVSEQLFATSTFTYGACVFCSTLSTTTTNFEVDLNKPTSTAPAVTDDIYWGINIPFGVSGAAHQGINTFYAVGD